MSQYITAAVILTAAIVPGAFQIIFGATIVVGLGLATFGLIVSLAQ